MAYILLAILIGFGTIASVLQHMAAIDEAKRAREEAKK